MSDKPFDLQNENDMTDQALFELRMYQVEPGRMNDMLARLYGPLKVLFDRHGIHPLRIWRSLSGPQSPQFIYLMRWASMGERDKAWAGFYGDPQWHLARAETNRGSELVERYELNFMHEVMSWCDPAGQLFACEELYLPQIAIGANATARKWMADQLAQVIGREGGHVVGAFEFMTGNDLPRACLVLGWESHVGRERAADLLEVAPLGRAMRLQVASIPS